MFAHDSFLSTNGENAIITYKWTTDFKPKGIVQIVHGMREHMGRYNEFADFLNANGYIVAGHDHLGHGKTALEYGMFGYFGEKQGAKYLVDDSRMFTRILRVEYPDLPIYLLGHSMGSFISRMQVLNDSELINGYICMGSSDINNAAPYLRGLAGANARVEGPRKVSLGIANLMQKLVFSRAIGKDDSEDAWISHDKEIVEAYTNDNLTRFYFTNAGYCDLMDLTMASTADEWFYNLDSSLPIFVLSGEEDPMSEKGKGIKKVYDKLENLTMAVNAEYKVYPNMRHEVLNEVNRETVYIDILNWIGKYNDYYGGQEIEQ